MSQIKFELAKLGLACSWIGAAVAACVLGYNIVFTDFGLFGMPLTIFGFVVMAAFMLLSYPMTKLRNKYRDEVEYDSNGISISHGNFSNLSNQERAEIEKQKLLQREMLIDSITLKNITKKGSKDPEKDLENMIGLSGVKTELHKMASRLAFNKEMQHGKSKRKNEALQADTANHMVFYGNPGTGKTTSVKIITGFLYKYGYIRKNQYVEVDGNFFNGSSFGESTKKVQFILGQAAGGVLFIDEAYALLNSLESQEVIATIVKTMEDKRSDLIIILAGYKKEMNALINSNTGLQSRVKYYFTFEDYDMNELWLIFKHMALEKGFSVDVEIKDNFTSYILEEMQKPNYGNARTVRNVLDKAIDNHSMNYMDGVIEPDLKMVLMPVDLPVKNSMVKISEETI
jgi:stage V sporulation protein K